MKSTFTQLLRSCVPGLLILCLSAAAVLSYGQGADAQAKGHLAFRSTGPDLKSMQSEMEQQSGASQESQKELDDLSEQKQTLEAQLTYAKSKLEAARKQFNVQTAAGNAEQADRAQQNMKDWESRVQAAEEQRDRIGAELQQAIQGMQPPPTSEQADLILPGENVEIFVVEDTSFNGRYPVRRGGYIILPAVGRIQVAGQSLGTAEGLVKKALENTQLRHATVMIEKVEGSDVESGPVIYLAGEFRLQSKPFRIPPGTKPTLVSVILSSGGVTDKADLSRVKLMRVAANKGIVEEVNVQRILDGGGLSGDVTLEEGDVIMVPAGTANVIFVTGNVKKQGSIPLRPGEKLSAYAAILQSGGFARFADLKKVYVLRATPDGTKIHIPVNVAAVQKGEKPDLPLEGNDILVVPEKFFSW